MNRGIAPVLMLLGWMVPATCLPGAEQEPDPPPTTQPATEVVVPGPGSQPVARLRLDPRGISSLLTAAEPDLDWVIPRKDHAWHYREWQWWRGHPWGETMRPRYWGRPRLHRGGAGEGYVRIDYEVDGFHVIQQFIFGPGRRPDEFWFDVVTTIENRSGADVEEYGQFFACYTPVNRRESSFFWEAAGRLVRWADRGVNHLEGYVVSPDAWFYDEDRIPHCPRGDGRIIGAWRRPVLVSHASPAGWRTALFVEESRCAAVTQGKDGNAMDYIVYPGHTRRTFEADSGFSTHIRHHIAKRPKLPGALWLAERWNAFDSSHAAVHDRAANLRQ